MNNVFIKKGDIIVFDDKHKIYCGDSTLKESYDFMGDEIASMCFTSPPYNCGANNYGANAKQEEKKYVSKSDDLLNDEQYLDLIKNSLKNSLEHSKYVFYNIAHLSGNKISLIDFLYCFKEKFVDTMIWKKTTTMPGIEPNILNSDFEYIYIYTNILNNGKHIRIGKDFKGTISNVVELPRNTKNEYAKIHRALMPLQLCDYMITNFTNENDIVLDCFSGLATNMISCIKNNRIYRGIELSPFYCQETIKRFLEYDMGKRNIKIIRDNKEIQFSEFKDYVLDNQLSIFDL